MTFKTAQKQNISEGGGGELKLNSLYCTINLSIVDTFIGSYLF